MAEGLIPLNCFYLTILPTNPSDACIIQRFPVILSRGVGKSTTPSSLNHLFLLHITRQLFSADKQRNIVAIIAPVYSEKSRRAPGSPPPTDLINAIISCNDNVIKAWLTIALFFRQLHKSNTA